MDRYKKLAEILVNYSTKVKKGDTVKVSGQPVTIPLFKEIVKLCYQKGAFVRPYLYDEEISYLEMRYASDHVLKTPSKFGLFDAQNTDVFISLHGDLNTRTFSNIDPKRLQAVRLANIKARKIIIGERRWVVCAFPSPGLAQDAHMSLEEYEDFVFSACLCDWEKMSEQCKKLGDLMKKAKKVRIVGEETDLTVGIEGCLPDTSIIGAGQGVHNMPDGEVFTSPQRSKTEGHIYFPWPSIKAKEVKNVRLEFKKGRVSKATSSQNEDYLHEVLKTDKLSDSLGEVAIGMNYGIKKYTNNILFDEKIGGTVHIAIGAGYKDTGGNPNSAVHWDFVKDLRDGGEVWFDDKVVMKDGKVII